MDEASSLGLVTVAEFLAYPPEPETWLAEPYLSAGALTVVQGEPGGGKTWFTMYLAQLAAIGGFRTVYIAAEGGKLEYWKRFKKMLDDVAMLESRLRFSLNAGLMLDNDVAVDAAILELMAIQPQLVVLDPLTEMHMGNENDQEDALRLRNAVQRMRRELDCGILVAHHTVKGQWNGGRPSLAGGSGALGSYFARAADMVLDISPIRAEGEEDLEENRVNAMVTVHKNRNGVACPKEAIFNVEDVGETAKVKLLFGEERSALVVNRIHDDIKGALKEEPLSARQLEKVVKGKSAVKRRVIREMINTGILYEGLKMKLFVKD